jgi:predicted RNase H-like nuclease (RuvC/YqgF family)
MSLEKISELERQISEMANVHENALRAKNDQMEQMTTQLDDVRNKFSEQEASYSQLLSHNETQINMLTTQLADVKERYEAHLEKM